MKSLLESKVKVLEETKSKYELRLKTYGTTIRQMDLELKQHNAKKVNDGKAGVADKELEEKARKATNKLVDKQKEFKVA